MKAKLIAVYGVLAHEKHPYYIFRGNRACTDTNYVEDEVWVELPDSLEPIYHDAMDDITIKVGYSHDQLNNYLDNVGDRAVVRIYDAQHGRTSITYLKRTSAPAE